VIRRAMWPPEVALST